jgi:catechol 2,3-dioxygenase-like lactoylglutathione lyase family enzyme
MKSDALPIRLGVIGHFGLAVRDPKVSAKWWTKHFDLKEDFRFEGGIAVSNEAITIALREGVPHPGTFGHVSFHVRSLKALRDAVVQLRAGDVTLEDPGDEIGPEAPGSKNLGVWFHDIDGYRWELSLQRS